MNLSSITVYELLFMSSGGNCFLRHGYYKDLKTAQADSVGLYMPRIKTKRLWQSEDGSYFECDPKEVNVKW